MGVKYLRRHLRTRDFPFTTGELLKAVVAYSSDGESGGFAPSVEFAYTVDGVRYQSGQLTALSAQVMKRRQQDVQGMLDRLRAEPALTVFYDPKAPWDGFLKHGPVWGAVLPFFMGAAFGGVGIGLMVYLLSGKR